MSGGQVDIFGELTVPEPEPPGYMQPPVAVDQPRLFEPQMEGQRALGETGE